MNDENKVELITVKSARLDGRTVLWERSADHITDENKTGEIFISGDGREHKVARTPDVTLQIREGGLVEVGKEQEFAAARGVETVQQKADEDSYRETLRSAEAERNRLAQLAELRPFDRLTAQLPVGELVEPPQPTTGPRLRKGLS